MHVRPVDGAPRRHSSRNPVIERIRVSKRPPRAPSRGRSVGEAAAAATSPQAALAALRLQLDRGRRQQAQLALQNRVLDAEVARLRDSLLARGPAGDGHLRADGAALTMPGRDTRQRIAESTFEAHSAMAVTDLAGLVIEANQAFGELVGYDAADLRGSPLASLLPSAPLAAGRRLASADEIRRTVQLKGYWQGEIACRHRSGREVPTLQTVTSVRDDLGRVTHYVNAYADISEQKAAEARIRQLAYYDTLTELPNRRLLIERLSQSLASARRSGLHAALLFLDLDQFKTLNDTLGHERGDELLVQVARRLREALRESDTVARFGGDEFVVLLHHLDASEAQAVAQAGAVALKLRDAVGGPYRIGGDEYHSGATVGVCLFGRTEARADDLLKQADLALHQAKESGGGSIRFFNPAMQAAIDARARLDASLRKAIAGDELVLMYQAQVDVRGRLTGAEALLRWHHPTRGIVGPLEFIQHAEETGLIEPIGAWVLDMACRQLASWARWPATARLKLSVNISPRQFRQPDFVADVLRIIALSGANPALLNLELTENVLIDDVDEAILRMRELKARGVGFAIDDFGTGYSSLAYLKRLPVDQIKIDRGFVRDLGALDADPPPRAAGGEVPLDRSRRTGITEAIIAMGRTLGLEVVAEGVETRAQHRFLADRGCHSFQGFLFGRPVASTASLLAVSS